MVSKNLFKAGYVAKAHGLKGEITVNLEKVMLPDIVKEVFLEFQGQYTSYVAEQFSARPDKAFIKLAGIDSLEQAQNLRGHVLYLKIPSRLSTDKSGFYEEEIRGFHVDDTELGRIGQAVRITNLGSNVLLEILHEGREILIPVNGPFIQKVDKRKKLIVVSLPEGFTEI